MTELLIEGGEILNEGCRTTGWIRTRGDRIAEMGRGAFRGEFRGERIDARGMTVMPGAIDAHVHFREPGLTQKADIATESAAAVAGGVTSYMEMPNTLPATVTRELWERKTESAEGRSAANYSFWLGATNDNIGEIRRADLRRTCGVKLFMGSSTGNMLVDDRRALSALFEQCELPIAAHCEDEARIRERSAQFRARYGDVVPASAHPQIRDAEACYRSSAAAVELADRYGAQLHVAHVTTARELALFDRGGVAGKKITAEVCVPHLWFCDADYERLGMLIKCNPAVKSAADRQALREALRSGKLDTVATDHAPHEAKRRDGVYWNTPSGMPMVQHSVAAMWTLCDRGLLSPEELVEKMCHAPAVRFAVKERGFLRPGYYADIVVVAPRSRTVERSGLLYKCGWSPLEGESLSRSVVCTIVNGEAAVRDGRFLSEAPRRGRMLEFER
ncbi:MAG: dihydroorotase [Rikenellaceae bacterium]|nr:dihydroorotase [Rikenellaceae bacterium]